MLWRLMDIPHSALALSSIRWTVSWIVLLSVIYTYFLNRLTQDSKLAMQDNADPVPPAERRRYLLHQRRLQAEKQALAAKREALLAGTTFRLFALPPELALLVLSHAADWPRTYLALMQVSRACQRLALHACLPQMAVRLITATQIAAFVAFLKGRPRAALLVRHIWVTPLSEAQRAPAVWIVQSCTNLRALATSAHILLAGLSVARRGAEGGAGAGVRMSHGVVVDLTLLATRAEGWGWLKGSAHGAALLKQVTRLRVIGPALPLPALERLTHLSYGTSGGVRVVVGGGGDGREGLACLQDREKYPALRQVVFTRPRGSTGGMRVLRPVAGTRLFVMELAATHTELEIWCDSVSRRGIWEVCADTPANASPRRM